MGWKLSPKARRRLVANLEGYAYISPWIIGFLVFFLFPFFASFALSFTSYDIISMPKWRGFANYSFLLFQDRYFTHSLWVTVKYVIVALPLQLVFALAVALLLNTRVRFMGLYRTIYYLPSVVPAVAASLIWLWIFNPHYGVINTVLNWIGITGPNWLGDPRTAGFAVAIMSLWTIGGTMIIFLAGLQGVPEELYEAASLEGARGWAVFRRITIPLISPTIFFNLIIGLIGAFQVFTQVYILGRGYSGGHGMMAGPDNSLLFYALYLYQNAFVAYKMGYASAQAWILLVIILVLTLVQFKLANRWVYYAGEDKR